MKELLNNQVVRLSNKSITVKNENGKTKNVITGIEMFSNMAFNKQMDWNIKFRKYGKMPLERMFLYKNKWYLLMDKKYIPTYLSNTDYTDKIINITKEKLNNATSFGVEIIDVLEFIDTRK